MCDILQMDWYMARGYTFRKVSLYIALLLLTPKNVFIVYRLNLGYVGYILNPIERYMILCGKIRFVEFIQSVGGICLKMDLKSISNNTKPTFLRKYYNKWNIMIGCGMFSENSFSQ